MLTHSAIYKAIDVGGDTMSSYPSDSHWREVMLCPHCKEELKQGARKCRFCGERLDSRSFLGILRLLSSGLLSVVTVLIPVASLVFAYDQNQSRKEAVEAQQDTNGELREKIAALADADLAMEVERSQSLEVAERLTASLLQGLSPSEQFDVVSKAAIADESESSGYSRLDTGQYAEATREFRAELQQDPKNIEARTGLYYSEILSKLDRMK